MRKLILALVILLTMTVTVQAEILMEWRADQRFHYTLQGEQTAELNKFVEEIFGPYSLGSPVLTEIRIQEAIAAPNHVMVYWKFDDLAGYSAMVGDQAFEEIASYADSFHEDISIHLWRSAPWAPETMYAEPELKGTDKVIFYIRADIVSDYAVVAPGGPLMVQWSAELVEQWAALPGVIAVSSYYTLAADWQVLFDVRFADFESWLAFQQNETVQDAKLDMRRYFTRIETELWEPMWFTPEALFPPDHQ